MYTEFEKPNEQLKRVRDYFEDEISKNIFDTQLLMLLGKPEYWKMYRETIPSKIPYVASLKVFLENNMTEINRLDQEKVLLHTDNIILYGAGESGQRWYERLNLCSYPNVKWCDKNYKNLTVVKDRAVISPKELYDNYSNAIIIVTTTFVCYKDIYDQLIGGGIDTKNIYYPSIFYREQYFDDIIKLRENEVKGKSFRCLYANISVKSLQFYYRRWKS